MDFKCPADVTKMIPVAAIKSDSALDEELLKQMAAKAAQYIEAFGWCERVDHQYLAYGIGEVIAIFLVELTPHSAEVDRCLWVIVGDIPYAYIVVEDNPRVSDALESYNYELTRWVDAVRKGESVADCIPVQVEPTIMNAERLRKRVEFLRSEIMPILREKEERDNIVAPT